MKPGFLAAIAPALLSAGCFYTSTTVNLREFDARGASMERFRKNDESIQHLGRVRATGRTWLFGDCAVAADAALAKLLDRARSRGANRVLNTRFRGHWKYITEPVCRRNLNYVWLIVPAFLRVPSSVTVSGEAVFDPAFQPATVSER
jgi:hypothetical protein